MVDGKGSSQDGVEGQAGAANAAAAGTLEDTLHWYVLKVQSNREKSIRDAIMRKVKLDELEDDFGEVIIPTEKVVDTKGGKKKIREQKLYPGYLMIQMKMTEDTWYLVRNVAGVGDFTGSAGKPIPMQKHEIERMLGLEEVKEAEPTKVKIGLTSGEQVKIREGTFESFSGVVEAVDETNGKVSVLIEIFGRPTPVELDYWQVEPV
jgi:transcriptional antiterminator NusG